MCKHDESCGKKEDARGMMIVAVVVGGDTAAVDNGCSDEKGEENVVD